jgi:small subunit ribosomal protein S11
MAKKTGALKKRVVKVEPSGQAHVHAAQMASEECGKVAYDLGLRKVKVFVKGPGAGRESAIRSISNTGIEVTEIVDVTPMPHNGCRAPGRRRV